MSNLLDDDTGNLELGHKEAQMTSATSAHGVGLVFAAGEAAVVTDGAGVAPAVSGSILVACEATACHLPSRRAYRSRKRYSPLMSIGFFWLGTLFFAFFRMLRPVMNAASASSTVTFASAMSQASAVIAPDSILCNSSALVSTTQLQSPPRRSFLSREPHYLLTHYGSYRVLLPVGSHQKPGRSKLRRTRLRFCSLDLDSFFFHDGWRACQKALCFYAKRARGVNFSYPTSRC